MPEPADQKVNYREGPDLHCTMLNYHRATGGCNAYCSGNRHAIPMYTTDLDKPLAERQTDIEKAWPEVRIVDVIEARELPRERDVLAHPVDDQHYVTIIPGGEYIPVLYIVELMQTD